MTEQRVELPKKLLVTDGFKITEPIGDGSVNAVRILLIPSEYYLDDEQVGLKELIKTIVQRYNDFERLQAENEKNNRDIKNLLEITGDLHAALDGLEKKLNG